VLLAHLATHGRRLPVDRELFAYVGSESVERHFAIGLAIATAAAQYGVVPGASARIADIGCGCGRVAQFAGMMLDPSAGGRYKGFDTWREGVAWGTANISPLFPHVTFHHLGAGTVDNYVDDAAYSIEVADSSQDGVIASSLFTHLKRDAARRYLDEIARILRPGGRLYLTAFASTLWCRHWNDQDEYGRYCYSPGRTDTYLHDGALRDELARCGLEVVCERLGHWRADSSAPKLVGSYQDLFIVERIGA